MRRGGFPMVGRGRDGTGVPAGDGSFSFGSTRESESGRTADRCVPYLGFGLCIATS